MSAPAAHQFRFALPPSLGEAAIKDRALRLERYLTRSLGRFTEVSVATSYDALCKDLLAGRIDAAWAPPFVCARVEAMGVRVLMRGVRSGASTYRAALVSRKGANLSLEKLSGLSAVWVDKDSVGGYLLAAAFLRSKGIDPKKALFAQAFAGSYRAALDLVASGKADFTSVFATSVGAPLQKLGIAEILPERAGELEAFAFTDESPNDGVAVSMQSDSGLQGALQKAVADLSTASEGQQLLKELFNAERFEAAPRMSYRALYRVALATL